MNKQITLRNIHSGDEMQVELISTKQTWQTEYTIRYAGTIHTVTNAQGWTVKKESK